MDENRDRTSSLSIYANFAKNLVLSNPEHEHSEDFPEIMAHSLHKKGRAEQAFERIDTKLGEMLKNFSGNNEEVVQKRLAFVLEKLTESKPMTDLPSLDEADDLDLLTAVRVLAGNEELLEQYRGPIPGKDIEWREKNWCAYTSDGKKLTTYRTLASHEEQDRTKPKAILFIWHGWNSNAQRLAHVAQTFAKEGLDVYGMDYRGHGESEGDRCYFESFEEIISDATGYVGMVLQRYENLNDIPVFSFGLSMGGLLALNLSLRDENTFSGLLLCAPALKPNDDYFPMLRKLVKGIAFAIPKLPITSIEVGDGNLFCKNPAVLENIKEDDLIYKGKVKAATGASLLKAVEEIDTRLEEITAPFIIVQGNLDFIVHPSGPKDLFDRAATIEKKLIYYPGVYHAMFSEPEWQQILADLQNWTTERIVTFKQAQIRKNKEKPAEKDLPQGWEMKLDPQGKSYFVDHNNQISTYEDPRLRIEQPDDLPPGWEMKLDSNENLYFVDHKNRISTYRDPRSTNESSNPTES